jgi:hypothetical protein
MFGLLDHVHTPLQATKGNLVPKSGAIATKTSITTPQASICAQNNN